VLPGLVLSGAGGVGGEAAREPAERGCIRLDDISSVLVERRGCQAAGGVVSAWRAAVAGVRPAILLPCSRFRVIAHDR